MEKCCEKVLTKDWLNILMQIIRKSDRTKEGIGGKKEVW